jgi:hypothetical protein
MGGTGTTAYLHRRQLTHHGLPMRPTTSTFESYMLTMQMDNGVGSRELATPTVCGIWMSASGLLNPILDPIHRPGLWSW